MIDEKTMKKLHKSSMEDNTFLVHEQMIENNPMLLVKVKPIFTENQLHFAALEGKAEFAVQLLKQAPWMAKQPSNREGLTALHIAAATNHADVVYVLQEFDPSLALIRDTEGSTPLHYAAHHGSADAARRLVSTNYELLKEVNLQGETALHVAVKSNQDEMTKLLMDLVSNTGDEFLDQMMDMTDTNGHSVRDLLAIKSQAASFLQANSNPASKVKPRNKMVNNKQKKGLKYLGTKIIALTKLPFFREIMLGFAGLIVQATFQAIVNPPQSLWRNGVLTPKALKNSAKNTVPWRLLHFLIANTVAFCFSCMSIVVNAICFTEQLIIGLVILGVSLVALVVSYYFVLVSLMDNSVVPLLNKYVTTIILIPLFASIVLIIIVRFVVLRYWVKITKVFSRNSNSNTNNINGNTTNGDNNVDTGNDSNINISTDIVNI